MYIFVMGICFYLACYKYASVNDNTLGKSGSLLCNCSVLVSQVKSSQKHLFNHD